MRRLFLVVVALFVVAVPYSLARSGSSPATYYVSPSGSDANPGTASAPWQTVSRVNRASLQPGDSVLFQGGQIFSGTALMPPTSGTAQAPIVFGSYGTGRAKFTNTDNDVWIPSGGHDLVFENLDLSGSSILFASSASGPGTYDITIRDSILHDTPQTALNMAQHSDHDWTITRSTFRHIGDSGMIILGSNVSITHSTITDTGWNPAITWGKHGIYDKGEDTTVAFNDFSDNANGQAVSVRMHGARIYGNTIHDTAYVIAFFDYDPTVGPQGVDYVYNNRFWNLTGYGFYYSDQADPQGNPPTVSFVVASNTFEFAKSSEAVNVSEVPSGAAVTLANNVFTGSYGSAYRGCATCREFNNDWFGGSSNVPSGKGDMHVNPVLAAAPSLAPPRTSPILAAGTALVNGLSYKAACDGGVLHYCGSSPAQGAVATPSGLVTRVAAGTKKAGSAKLKKPSSAKPLPARASGAARARAGKIVYFTYKKKLKLHGLTLHFRPGRGYYYAA